MTDATAQTAAPRSARAKCSEQMLVTSLIVTLGGILFPVIVLAAGRGAPTWVFVGASVQFAGLCLYIAAGLVARIEDPPLAPEFILFWLQFAAVPCGFLWYGLSHRWWVALIGGALWLGVLRLAFFLADEVWRPWLNRTRRLKQRRASPPAPRAPKRPKQGHRGPHHRLRSRHRVRTQRRTHRAASGAKRPR